MTNEEGMKEIVNFAINNNLPYETPEQVQEILNRWIKSQMTFYKKFDELSLSHKMRLLNIKLC